MVSPQPIRYWNRKLQREETEKVLGDSLIQLLYGTRTGQTLAEKLFSGRLLSRLYGSFQASPFSKRQIPEFIKNFHIPMQEYEKQIYFSFNDFFIRRFKEGARPFAEPFQEFPAPAEARYFAYNNVDASTEFPVKGIRLNPAQLLGGLDKAKPFLGGPVLLARLCPVDYHRFHYPDAGETLDTYRLHGKLHSVNPAALAYRGDILITNERHVSILKTKNFGKIAFVEVGALCVGKIVQTHPEGVPFERGDEKGYFLFGGSTIVVLGEPGAWQPSEDLLSNTARGLETLVRLGESVGQRSQ